MQYIIAWLGDPTEDVQLQAARAMLAGAGNNTATQQLIGKLGGIPPLVKLVESSTLEARVAKSVVIPATDRALAVHASRGGLLDLDLAPQ